MKDNTQKKATITGIEVTYDEQGIFFSTELFKDDSNIEVVQAGGVSKRRRTNRKRRSSRRN